MRLITSPAWLISGYVSRKIGLLIPPTECAVFGLINEEKGVLAGVVFNGYAKPNILMHIAAERLTPTFVAAIMHYAFVQCECKRVTGVIERQNHGSIAFAQKLGAEYEGTLRDAGENGDLEIYGLMRDRGMRWLTPRNLQKLEAIKSWV